MSDHHSDARQPAAPFDGSFDGTRRRQITAGLELDPAARLRWLEERMAELFRLKGKAGGADPKQSPPIP